MPAQPPASSPSSPSRRTRNAANTPQRVAVPPEAARRLQSLATALRAGATSLALIGGIACYLLLVSLSVNTVWAAVLGLVFALLGRVAAVSLGREWLLHTAHQRLLREQAASGTTASATPRPGEAPPPHHSRRKGS